jgi:hypothetical protein
MQRGLFPFWFEIKAADSSEYKSILLIVFAKDVGVYVENSISKEFQ